MTTNVPVARRWARTSLPIGQRGREEIWGYLCISPWIIGFLFFTLGPMVYSAYLSFFKADFLTEPRFVGLQNYKQLFFEDEYWPVALRNTATYAFVSVPLHTTIAFMIALLLNQEVKALGVFRTIYYLPSVVQGVAVSVLWGWLFNPFFGPINGALKLFGIRGPNWLGSEEWALPALILMAQWNAGGAMVIFLAGLKGVPESLHEAASIDGAGVLARFWHITVPMMTPTIFFSLIMGLIGSWQTFTQAYVLTEGGPNNATLTAVMHIYRKAFEQFYFGYASAMAWILFAIILFFTLIVFRSSVAWVYYEGELRK
ncbi:MAG TPA: sugar ABC transporter permease [Candidatus Hydrogenedentes bacterium]|nr:sugar ABC transporter permease [Candidatus Hydrogenedentota bacterium]